MTISRRRRSNNHSQFSGIDWLPWIVAGVVIVGLAILVWRYPVTRLNAQTMHDHAQFHYAYQNWRNGIPQGCCNNMDCSPIRDDEERTVRGQLQVRVKGEWCPVLSHHYLTQGNVPDASVSHICVSGHYGGRTPCEQLICYQPKPGT